MNTTALYESAAKMLSRYFELSAGEGRLPTTLLLIVITMLVAWVAYQLLCRLVEPMIHKLTRHTSAKWDDILLGQKVVQRVWRLVVVFILSLGFPMALKGYPKVSEWTDVVFDVVLIVATAMLAMTVIRSIFEVISAHTSELREGNDIYDHNPAVLEEKARRESHSLGGVSQMLQLAVAIIALILIFSLLSGKNVLVILSGIGASAAVLMLVFKDSLLGLVAGVQITANDMLRPGDWISIPKHNVNGRVRRINLTTVKVQNFDNTIVTVPPYLLVSDTFQNWRGMERSGGRRVKRSLNIDMQTVRFCTPEEIERYSTQLWWNRVGNPGRPVNVSVFRAYVEHYLSQLPSFVDDMLFMVRELQPEAHGLPVEIYFFTSKIAWVEYEAVQANVFDHVVAVLSEFGLSAYQAPSSTDIRSLAASVRITGQAPSQP